VRLIALIVGSFNGEEFPSNVRFIRQAEKWYMTSPKATAKRRVRIMDIYMGSIGAFVKEVNAKEIGKIGV